MGSASAARLLDDVDAEQVPGEVLAAVPAGSMLARGPGTWIRVVECCADEALLRADAREHLMAIAWIYARHVNWYEHTSRPSRQLMVELSGLSASTVKRWTRWLREHGLLGELERGCLAKFRRRRCREHDEHDDHDQHDAGDHASVQVLCIPDRWAHARLGQPKPPALSPPVVETVSALPPGLLVDETDPSTQLLCVLKEDPFARENQPGPLRGLDCSAELRQALDEATSPAGGPPGYGWTRHAVAHTRAERLALAATLQDAAPDLARISTRNIRSVLRPWLSDPSLGWSVHWLQWAIDHAPGGTARTWTSAVHSPAGWLRSRLSAWTGANGDPAPAPGVAIAAARDAELARLAAARAGQQRVVQQADAQREFGLRIRAIAADDYQRLLTGVLGAAAGSSYLPAAARAALVREAVCGELGSAGVAWAARGDLTDTAVRSAIDTVLAQHATAAPPARPARRSVATCRDAGSRRGPAAAGGTA